MRMDAGSVKKMIIDLVFCLIVTMGAELFLFNYQSLATVDSKEIIVPLDYCIYEGLNEIKDDGSAELDCGENGAFVQFAINDIGIEPENIALSVSCTDGYESWWGYMRTPYAELTSPAVKVTVLLECSEGNVILQDRLLYGREGEKEIINLPSGRDVSRLTLQLNGLKGKKLLLRGISINSPVSMKLKPLRMIIIFAFLLFLCLFRPGSFLWSEPLLTDEGKLRKKYLVATLAVLAVLIVMVPLLISKNQIYMQSENAFHPYTDLARVLAKGQLYLDIEPSPELLAMDNPYDPVAREDTQVPFQLDYAYFEGKYYIYFGVIPCLLLYLPWYLVSGTDMPGWIAMSVMLLLCCCGIWFMIKNIVKRYCPKIAAAYPALTWMGAVAVLSLPAAMGDVSNYYAPMLAAVDCFVFGMAANLSAVELIESDQVKKGRIMLGAGSLLMVSIAGCRPQLVLGAVCTLPFLLPILFRKKEGKIRPDMYNLCAFALPYIFVAAGLMIYNALRFGSPFDFGAMKNLTFAYLDKAGFNLTAAGAGLYYYLFRLPALTPFYPYLGRSTFVWSNPNMLASHPSTGGLFMLYPILLLCFACLIRQKDTRGRELKLTGILALMLVPVLAAVTAVMGGLMDRYRMDIAPFAALALICGIFCFLSADMKKTPVKLIRLVLTGAVIVTIIVSGLTYGTEGLNYLQDVNPEAYMNIAKTIEFWR